jgi:hypothetical protein
MMGNMDNPIDPKDTVERYFTVLKSLNEFDKEAVRGLVQGLLALSKRELCFTGSYYRAVGNIETTLTLKNVRDFQAIAMMSRSIFEIAVDLALAVETPESEKHIIAHADVEKLRAARKIVEFTGSNPGATVHDATYREFIASQEDRIDQEAKALWPTSYNSVAHWSGINLEKRVAKMGMPFTQVYAVNYPQLSWYAHAGIAGVLNLEKESFRMLAGVAFTVMAEMYMVVLAIIIKQFKINKANDKISDLMTLAKMLPFTDGAIQAEQLRKALLG